MVLGHDMVLERKRAAFHLPLQAVGGREERSEGTRTTQKFKYFSNVGVREDAHCGRLIENL